jgi:transketolase
MAIASRWLAARYNKPGFELFDFNVYALCSDGDLMEGVCAEAASLAGHLRLSNLCWIYDDNRITIEGDTSLAFSEDVGTRFQGYGWQVIRIADANDLDALRKAYREFHQTADRPTMIIVRSHIAYGSPNKVDTHEAHGAPLGEDEIKLTKAAYGWPQEEKFRVPPEVLAHFKQGIGKRGAAAHAQWNEKFGRYRQEHPLLAAEIELMQNGELPAGWEQALPTFPADAKGVASRTSSGKVLNALAAKIPWLIGGSADLAPSTMTLLKFDGAGHFGSADYSAHNFHFGIREHGMAAACNGMALCGLRPFGATFFIFSDYLRPSMRLAALMGLPVLYVFTHDSIGVGEDGPTHQPVEHLAACRAIPGLYVMRPGDANEVSEAYRVALNMKDHPLALVLTRQNLPTLDRTKYASAAGVGKGAYVVLDAPGGKPQVILMGTGSEMSLCVEAAEQLQQQGIAARAVSMPCWELFEQQDPAYRESVLPAKVTARVAVEAGVELGWERYLGPTGRFVGMRSFGASGPGGALYKHFGITTANVIAQAQAVLGKK